MRRLLEYQQVREVVDILEARSDDRRNRFARAYLPQNLLAPAPVGALSVSISELLGAVDRVLRAAKRPDMHDVVPRALDVDGAMSVVRAVLAMRARARWRDIIARRRRAVAGTLGSSRAARAGQGGRAASHPAAPIRLRGDHK